MNRRHPKPPKAIAEVRHRQQPQAVPAKKRALGALQALWRDRPVAAGGAQPSKVRAKGLRLRAEPEPPSPAGVTNAVFFLQGFLVLEALRLPGSSTTDIGFLRNGYSSPASPARAKSSAYSLYKGSYLWCFKAQLQSCFCTANGGFTASAMPLGENFPDTPKVSSTASQACIPFGKILHHSLNGTSVSTTQESVAKSSLRVAFESAKLRKKAGPRSAAAQRTT